MSFCVYRPPIEKKHPPNHPESSRYREPGSAARPDGGVENSRGLWYLGYKGQLFAAAISDACSICMAGRYRIYIRPMPSFFRHLHGCFSNHASMIHPSPRIPGTPRPSGNIILPKKAGIIHRLYQGSVRHLPGQAVWKIPEKTCAGGWDHSVQLRSGRTKISGYLPKMRGGIREGPGSAEEDPDIFRQGPGSGIQASSNKDRERELRTGTGEPDIFRQGPGSPKGERPGSVRPGTPRPHSGKRRKSLRELRRGSLGMDDRWKERKQNGKEDSLAAHAGRGHTRG